MKNINKLSKWFLLIILTININADHHKNSDHHKNEVQSFPGLISSEVFKLANDMDMHVERRKTCNQGAVAKHFHPAEGTLVFVLDGKSQSCIHQSQQCHWQQSNSFSLAARSKMANPHV